LKSLIVIALCLAVSPALAGDNSMQSQEQTQKEQNQSFMRNGIRKYTYDRYVISGNVTQLGFFSNLNADCSSIGDTEIRVAKAPKHGTTEARGFPQLQQGK